MTEHNLKQLLSLLDEYYREKAETCNYNCDSCNLSALDDYGYGKSCVIELAWNRIVEELYL